MGLAHSALLQLSLSSSSSPCMMLSSSSSVKCRHWNQTWRDSALFHLKSIKLRHFILYLVILESALRQYQCNCFISSHNSVITNSRTQVSWSYLLFSFPVCALLQICGLGKVGSLHRGVIGSGQAAASDQVCRQVRILALGHLTWDTWGIACIWPPWSSALQSPVLKMIGFSSIFFWIWIPNITLLGIIKR